MSFKILVVEDNTDKLRAVLQTLEQVIGLNEEDITTELDAHSAKRHLQHQAVDLLILDISIPPRKAAEIEPEGGLLLLEEILSRPQYHKPAHIIALTAHEELLATVRPKLAEQTLSVIHFQAGTSAWQRQLLTGVERRLAAKQSTLPTPLEYDYDVAFICALRSECSAVRANGWAWSSLSVPGDDSLYYQATYTKADGRLGKAVAMAAARMGMPAAAAATMKLVLRFRPRYVFMTGIMGGVEGRVNLGDLVIASPVWDWGNGKWVTIKQAGATETTRFEADPFQFTLDKSLERMALLLEEDGEALYHMRHSVKATAPERDLKLRIGAVASGAAVLASQDALERVKEQHRKLLGIEMEAYGVLTALSEAPHPRPLGMCIKAVVDFSNGHKDDTYQEYGTQISAKAAQYFVEKHCG
jgi:nucleoside phosphorylase/CheY-like chemotaxis protein